MENNKHFNICISLFQNNSKFFCHATTFNFTTDIQKKAGYIFSHIFLLPPRSVPHNKYAQSSNGPFNGFYDAILVGEQTQPKLQGMCGILVHLKPGRTFPRVAGDGWRVAGGG